MSETANTFRLHATVRGEVQGVGYRAYVQAQAKRLSLRGWVRNLPDGNVEVLAEGSRGALETLVAAMLKGPPASRVAGIDDEWSDADGGLPEFTVRYAS